MSRVYLDHNATTPVDPAVRAAMVAALDVYGNPSSVHAEGRRARGLIDEARWAVSAFVGTAAEDVIFTSGATEALNMVLSPDPDRSDSDYLLMSAGEHPAVLMGHRFGAAAETLPLTGDGVLDLSALEEALARLSGKRVTLALQAANNETGVVQPVREAAALVHAHGGHLVCDAVQAAGKIACDVREFGADALALSAHKFGGPKGVGALCFGPSAHHLKRGLVRGGGQERGIRAGTENLVGIVGMGAACEVAEVHRSESQARLTAMRDWVETIVTSVAPEVTIFGKGALRLANTTCFAMRGVDARIVLMSLDLAGIALSAGSACASGIVKPSHVLESMGVFPDLARSALRISLGWTTVEGDIEAFANAFTRAVQTMRPQVAA